MGTALQVTHRSNLEGEKNWPLLWTVRAQKESQNASGRKGENYKFVIEVKHGFIHEPEKLNNLGSSVKGFTECRECGS